MKEYMTINQRRAEFVYEAARLAAIAASAPIIPAPYAERAVLQVTVELKTAPGETWDTTYLTGCTYVYNGRRRSCGKKENPK